MALNLTDAEAATVLRQFTQTDYAQLSSGAIVLYDYAITFGLEVDLIWPQKTTAPKVLFIINRISMILFGVSQVLDIPNWKIVHGCEFMLVFSVIPQVLLMIIWSLFSSLRAYALADRGRVVAGLVFVFSIMPVALSLYEYGSATGFYVYSLSSAETLCEGAYNVSYTMQNVVATWTDAALIAADVAVLAVTWWRTYRIKKYARRYHMQTPLVTLLLRDGAVYFLLFLILNVVEIALWLKDFYVNISTYITAITSIIVSRFLLSLRQVNDTDVGGPADTDVSGAHGHSTSRVSHLRFSNTVVGNMGADVDTVFAVGSDLEDYSDDGDESTMAGEGLRDGDGDGDPSDGLEMAEIERV